MNSVGSNIPSWVGFEWAEAVQHAAQHGIKLHKEITSPPRRTGEGTLRVIRQTERDGRIICTCAAEEWGET